MVEDRQRIVNFLDAFYSGDIDGALASCNEDIDFVAHARSTSCPIWATATARPTSPPI